MDRVDLVGIAGNRRCSQKDRGKMCNQPRDETHGSLLLSFGDGMVSLLDPSLVVLRQSCLFDQLNTSPLDVQESSAWRKSLSLTIFKRWKLTGVVELVVRLLSSRFQTKKRTDGFEQKEPNKKESMENSQIYQGSSAKGCC